MVQRKLRVMLTFEGDPVAADDALDEWPDGLLARTANPTIPIFIVSAVGAHPQASKGAGCGHRSLSSERLPTSDGLSTALMVGLFPQQADSLRTFQVEEANLE